MQDQTYFKDSILDIGLIEMDRKKFVYFLFNKSATSCVDYKMLNKARPLSRNSSESSSSRNLYAKLKLYSPSNYGCALSVNQSDRNKTVLYIVYELYKANSIFNLLNTIWQDKC